MAKAVSALSTAATRTAGSHGIGAWHGFLDADRFSGLGNAKGLPDINGRPPIQIVGQNQVVQFHVVHPGNLAGRIPRLNSIEPAGFLSRFE